MGEEAFHIFASEIIWWAEAISDPLKTLQYPV